MCKNFIVTCALLVVFFPSLAQKRTEEPKVGSSQKREPNPVLFIDSLERSINPVIVVRDNLKQMYPARNLDSIASILQKKTLRTYDKRDFKIFSRINKDLKNVFYLDIPKNMKGVSDTTIKVGIYAEEDKDFYQEILFSKNVRNFTGIDFHESLGYRGDLHTIHDYSTVFPTRPKAQTYTLKISGRGPNVLVPLGYGLKNSMGCYALYKHEPEGKTRVIHLYAKKKRNCYIIKMKFSSKTMKLVLDQVSEGADKVITEVRIPRKYTKQDLFKASQIINDNVDLFMEINQD